MRSTAVFSIELTDQDLADLPNLATLTDGGVMVEIDIRGAGAQLPRATDAPAPDHYDLVEIELTAEEMDELLTSGQ